MQVKPQISRRGMRRLCALLLLLLSVGPWLLALSSADPTAEAALSACCRARGKHKCFMRLTREGGTASSSGESAVSQVSERCPHNPAWTTTAHHQPFDRSAKNVSETCLSVAASLVLVATRPRSSFISRANCKRGPPSPALSLKAMTDRLAARQRLPYRWRHDASIKTDSSFPWPDAPPCFDHSA
jgi:hypothetical protein